MEWKAHTGRDCFAGATGAGADVAEDQIFQMDVETDARALRPRIREGEIGCLFDEIQNLVEPRQKWSRCSILP
jgi:hypothetical protein